MANSEPQSVAAVYRRCYSIASFFLQLIQGRIPTETSDSELPSDVDLELVKPSVQLALCDSTVIEGGTVRLDCVIVGQPEPEVGGSVGQGMLRRGSFETTIVFV